MRQESAATAALRASAHPVHHAATPPAGRRWRAPSPRAAPRDPAIAQVPLEARIAQPRRAARQAHLTADGEAARPPPPARARAPAAARPRSGPAATLTSTDEPNRPGRGWVSAYARRPSGAPSRRRAEGASMAASRAWPATAPARASRTASASRPADARAPAAGEDGEREGGGGEQGEARWVRGHQRRACQARRETPGDRHVPWVARHLTGPPPRAAPASASRRSPRPRSGRRPSGSRRAARGTRRSASRASARSRPAGRVARRSPSSGSASPGPPPRRRVGAGRVGTAAAPAALLGTSTCWPSSTFAARLIAARSAPRAAPPARSSALATRSPVRSL